MIRIPKSKVLGSQKLMRLESLSIFSHLTYSSGNITLLMWPYYMRWLHFIVNNKQFKVIYIQALRLYILTGNRENAHFCCCCCCYILML